MSVVVPRPQVGSGVELFASALTVPYAAGMRTDTVPLAGGSFDVRGPRREPVLLVRLRRALADEAVLVRATVAGNPQPPVLFAPFSAEGTLLPVFRPSLPAGSDGTGDFAVGATVHRVTGETRYDLRPTPGAALGAAASAALVEGVVLEGRFARLLYLGTLGGQRAIRMAREIAAARYGSLAHARALDDRGLGLGVSRFGATEPDNRYRSRLGIYSAWRLPTPAGLALALNGPEQDTDPNAGLPATFGVSHRFRIVEETNDLSVATKLVAVGPSGLGQRAAFHNELRSSRLVDLEHVTSPLIPTARRQRYEAVRTNLRTELTRPTGTGRPQFLAPVLAVTLDRAVRLMRGLGHTAAIRLNKAYDPTGGSRYELGLGVDVGAATQVQVEAMADRVANLAGKDGELAALARALTPRSFADDPLARWLLEPCGFRTVHPLPGGDLHLSPLPTYGQFIEGPSDLQRLQEATYEARFLAGGSSAGVHIRAQEALDRLPAVFAARGLAPVPPALAPDAMRTALQGLAAAPTSPVVPAVLDAAVAAGLVTADAKSLAAQLVAAFNLDQVVALGISQAELAALGSGATLRDALMARAEASGEAGFYTVRAVWDTNRLLLLASVSQLPGAGSKPGEPPPAAFRWYETRVPGPFPGLPTPLDVIQPRGGRTTVRGTITGVGLIVCIGYARRGLADPFEVRIELDDPDALLDLDQYGYVMNLLEHLYPLGIEINTFDIRRRHVDADGDGEPEFLTSRASRSYHRYSHRRPFGSGRGRDQRGSAT